MRRYIFVLSVSLSLLLGSTVATATSRYGIVGGATFSSIKFSEMNRSSMTNWHAGLTYKLSLPLGFSVQPALMYHSKGGKSKYEDFDLTMGFMEIPVSVQWGPDLLLMRPFLDVTPFVGYAVSKSMSAEGVSGRSSWDGLRRAEYGIGVGLGLEIWRIQVTGRYIWNLGNLSDGKGTGTYAEHINAVYSNNNFQGVMLSASILFGGR